MSSISHLDSLRRTEKEQEIVFMVLLFDYLIIISYQCTHQENIFNWYIHSNDIKITLCIKACGHILLDVFNKNCLMLSCF